MCTGEVATHNQVIKVMDKTPPSLTCPDEHDIKFGSTNQVGYQDCTLRTPAMDPGRRRLLHEQQHDAVCLDNGQQWHVIIVSNMDSEGYFNFDLPVGFDYLHLHGDRRLRQQGRMLC